MTQSAQCFEQAQIHLVGGVNSPVRSFKAVGGHPIFFKQGQGAELIDIDGKHYIDFICSWGSAILGHAHPEVLAFMQSVLAQGLSFGAPTELETQLAQLLKAFVPSIELLRFVNSGTEATMSALRLARGYTGRNKILKYRGCYHGHSDSLLVEAGSGALTFGVPSSPGVTAATAADTLVADFNDWEQTEAIFNTHQDDLAAVIIEPIAGNMNCIPAQGDFLKKLRHRCSENQTVLIFDEVMTGFRVAKGGAQELYNIEADLVAYGKVIGGGMPLAAFGGKKHIMEHLAPLGPVYQAGTMSGNPIAVAAGIATLRAIDAMPDFYRRLQANTDQIADGLRLIANQHSIPLLIQSVPGMLGLFFTEQTQVTDYHAVSRCDIAKFNRAFHLALEQGIYLPPSAYEACFISIAHEGQMLDKALTSFNQIFSSIKKEYSKT